jgi:hypothetical protein
VEAKTGHSASIFGESMGSGAIFEAARIVNQFYEALHQEKNLTFNPSVIVGGTRQRLTDQPAQPAAKLMSWQRKRSSWVICASLARNRKKRRAPSCAR